MDELLTLQQVAKLLGLAERTIYVWSQEGKLPAFKLGTTWRYKEGEILEWLETQRTSDTLDDLDFPPYIETDSDFKIDKKDYDEEKKTYLKEKRDRLIARCEAEIKQSFELEGKSQILVENFEHLDKEILKEALQRLTKSKEFKLGTRKIGRERLRVLTKKVTML